MTPDAPAQPSDVEPTMLDTEPLFKPPVDVRAFGEPDPEATPRPEALPVSSAERYFTVDVLRGFALWASWR